MILTQHFLTTNKQHIIGFYMTTTPTIANTKTKPKTHHKQIALTLIIITIIILTTLLIHYKLTTNNTPNNNTENKNNNRPVR